MDMFGVYLYKKKEHDCVWKQLISIVFIYKKVFGNFYIKYVIKS